MEEERTKKQRETEACDSILCRSTGTFAWAFSLLLDFRSARGLFELREILAKLHELLANRRIEFYLRAASRPHGAGCGGGRGGRRGGRYGIGAVQPEKRRQVRGDLRVARAPVALGGNELVEVGNQLSYLRPRVAAQLRGGGKLGQLRERFTGRYQ